MARTPFAKPLTRQPAVLAALAAALLALLLAAAPAGAASNIGTPGVNWDGGPSAPTSDKPQSKVWYTTDAQGKVTWWATMWFTSTQSGAFQIARFDTASSSWKPTGTVVDSRSLSLQDTQWDGSHLYVASAVTQRPSQDPSNPSVDLGTRVMRFSFNPSNQTWTRDWQTTVETKHDVPATDPHGVAKTCLGQTGTATQCVGGTESVTLAKDAGGRVWVTDTRDTGLNQVCKLDPNSIPPNQPVPDPNLPGQCVQDTNAGVPQWSSTGRSVYVYSLSDAGQVLLTPTVLPVGTSASQINADDISSIVAFDGNVGVFWSNQNTGTFYFATHSAASPPNGAWSSQVAFAGFPGYTSVAAGAKGGWADDHINVKTLEGDPAGQVFAVVKTSRNDLGFSRNGDPVTVFLRRSAAGTWSGYSVNGVNRDSKDTTVDRSPTRAILSLDPTNRTAYVFSSSPCCSGGTIYEKLSNLDSPSFDSAASHVGAPFMYDASQPVSTPACKNAPSCGVNNPTTTKQPAPAGDFLYVLAGQVQSHFYWWNRIAINKPTPPLKPGDCPGDPRCPKQPPTEVCPGGPTCPQTPVNPPTPIVLDARRGSIAASLSYVRNLDAAAIGAKLRITRSGRVLLDASLASQCRSCRGKIDATRGRAPSLAVVPLQRGQDPQVLVSFQTGGRTISLIYRVRGGRLLRTGVDWGAAGFYLRDLNRDRVLELITRDTRFARVTGGGPDTYLPLRILSFRAGRLVVVTKRFPRSVSADATKLLRSYRALRRHRGHDLRGVLAAYVADLSLLGKQARAKPVLAYALRHGELGKRSGGPRGRQFVAWLPRFVRAAGYRR